MKIFISLDRDEIQAKIPYAMVCATMESSRWNTGKRKRAWTQEFTKTEQCACRVLGKMSHKWCLQTGAPESVRLMIKTLQLWQRLGNFCAAI